MTDLFRGENIGKTLIAVGLTYLLFLFSANSIQSIDSVVSLVTANVILLGILVGAFYVTDNFIEPNAKFLTKKLTILLAGFLGAFVYLLFIGKFDFALALDIATKSVVYAFMTLGVYLFIEGGK